MDLSSVLFLFLLQIANPERVLPPSPFFATNSVRWWVVVEGVIAIENRHESVIYYSSISFGLELQAVGIKWNWGCSKDRYYATWPRTQFAICQWAKQQT